MENLTKNKLATNRYGGLERDDGEFVDPEACKACGYFTGHYLHGQAEPDMCDECKLYLENKTFQGYS